MPSRERGDEAGNQKIMSDASMPHCARCGQVQYDCRCDGEPDIDQPLEPLVGRQLFGDWKPRPHDRLRKLANGTLFLLRLHTGAIHVCELVRNLPEDESWKARRLSDMKIVRLENLQRAEFILLSRHLLR